MGGAGQAAPGDLSKVTGLRGQVCGSCRRRTSDQGGCPEAPGALFRNRPLPGLLCPLRTGVAETHSPEHCGQEGQPVLPQPPLLLPPLIVVQVSKQHVLGDGLGQRCHGLVVLGDDLRGRESQALGIPGAPARPRETDTAQVTQGTLPR